MIIDTYVYFVSYVWSTKKCDRELRSITEYHHTTKIKTVNEISIIQDMILESLIENNKKDTPYGVRITNFQLLDSYNKEEREAKE